MESINEIKEKFARLHFEVNMHLNATIIASLGSSKQDVVQNLEKASVNGLEPQFLKLNPEDTFILNGVEVQAIEAGFDDDGDKLIHFHGFNSDGDIVSFSLYNVTDFVTLCGLLEYVHGISYREFLR